ncbi:hypothetical protein GOP47_0019222, partial [Adiantum capillus-veneris]
GGGLSRGNFFRGLGETIIFGQRDFFLRNVQNLNMAMVRIEPGISFAPRISFAAPPRADRLHSFAALPTKNDASHPCPKEVLIALLIETHKALQETESQDNLRRRFREVQGLGVNAKSNNLSPCRQLKVLDVHKYVHSYVYLANLRRCIQKPVVKEDSMVYRCKQVSVIIYDRAAWTE